VTDMAEVLESGLAEARERERIAARAAQADALELRNAAYDTDRASTARFHRRAARRASSCGAPEATTSPCRRRRRSTATPSRRPAHGQATRPPRPGGRG
jgi:hypothetical protein